MLSESGEIAQPSSASPLTHDRPIPTLLVEKELNYLHWLAQQLEGRGRVIELGCFLGGSTVALLNGLSRNPSATRPLLTYDAFETPGDMNEHRTSWLRQFGLKPGQRFRDRFDEVIRHCPGPISVRDQWLPSNANAGEELLAYPEQEPIELLFVDIAKAWDVNLTVLRAFGRHLAPGSIVVQQDFFDLQTPWIVLHMFQLREVLEPLDVVFGTSTVSFRCAGDIRPALAKLWNQSELKTRASRTQAWSRVRAYWSERIGRDFADSLSGHQAMHALYSGDLQDAISGAREYEAWSRSSSSDHFYFCPAWPDIMRELAASGDRHAAELAVECMARGPRLDRASLIEQKPYRTAPHRREVWGSLVKDLLNEGHRSAVLLGAGHHSRWLISQTDLLGSLHIPCVIDENPGIDSISGVPVLTPELARAHLQECGILLPSSDSFEEQLISRAGELFGDMNTIQIRRVYTTPRGRSRESLDWVYTVDATDIPEAIAGSTDKDRTPVADRAQHRRIMGLEPERDWTKNLAEAFRIPAWSQGSINQHEAAFLWDLVEASRPSKTIEIGTGSGVSTAALLASIDRFCADDARLLSFDSGTVCEAAPDQALAAAIPLMTPDLALKPRLCACADAVDAAACFAAGAADFAFIHGEQRHPGPALDLIRLLHAMRPGAWVALHTIAPEQSANGARRVLDAWPFTKVITESASIGAIMVPESRSDAISTLAGLLLDQWETSERPGAELETALDALRAHTP